jgi:GNAT superfamily N-acetyltransferase
VDGYDTVVVQRLSVRQFDVHHLSAAELAEIHEIRSACHRAAAPDEPFPTLAEWSALVTKIPPGVARWHWLADGGYAGLTRAYASARGRIEICVVPQARRHGIGSALLNEVTEAAKALGCETVIGRVGDHDGTAFAERVGCRAGNSQLRSVLTLPVAGTVSPVSGYMLVTWTGQAPDWLLESYAVARAAINDAPRSGAIPPEIWSPRRVRDMEQTVAARGRMGLVTVAVSDDQEVAGFTEVRVSPDPGAIASTEDTAVVAMHRGRGLARWIKAESLALLRRVRPDVTTVVTTNDTANAAMLVVNRRLGFVPVGAWTDMVLSIGQPNRVPGQRTTK